MNMDIKEYLKDIVKNLIERYEPVSVFVYGSFATNEQVDEISDIEIGIIKGEKKINFNEIKDLEKKFNKRNKIKIRIYYFDPNNFKTPFTESLFILKILKNNILLYGKPLFEIFEEPKISIIDIEREVGFNRGGILELYKRFRNNEFNLENKNDLCKYILYLAACLEMIHGIFVYSYKEIVEKYQWEFSDFVKQIYEIRSKNELITEELFYKCLQFSDYIEKEIKTYINEKLKDKKELIVL